MFDERLVDQIVSGVLERLQGRSDAVRAGTPEPRSPAPEPEQTGPTPNEVVLNERVITADLLERSVNGHRRIQIAAKAVLTPSAREFLRKSEVEWSRLDGQAAGPTGSGQWKAIVLEAAPVVSGAVEDMMRSGWQRELVGSVREAVEQAVGSICRGEAAGIVVFSEQADAIICRANRNPKVRGAVVTDVKHLDALRRGLGPNLIGIRPQGRSYFELRNLLRAFGDRPPQLPAGWDE
jgi:hypothetical protein